MSFSTDREALDALAALIFTQGYASDVLFEDGEVIARNLVSPSALFEAASSTGDPVKITLRRNDTLHGVFLVLLQDDPDCLIVDHSSNGLCQSIFDAWFASAEAAT